MKEIYFGGFRTVVIEHIKEIRDTEPESHTTEWFLVKYLNRIVKTIDEPASPEKIEGTIRSLVRFYVDNIEENTELGDRCTRIYEEYKKALREQQERDSK